MASKIIFQNVSYNYSSNGSSKGSALSNVSFHVRQGSFTMVIGHTGSGKSTLIQQINGLLRPTQGIVKVAGINVTNQTNAAQIKKLRRMVGLVFQIPQDQLFGETVKDDLAFGPQNFGFNKDRIKSAVKASVKLLKLGPLLSRSPFDLSGGQMKRVAIAGVLVCHPQILVLDEPTVGLDYYGESRIMKVINRLRKRFNLTVIMVTHQMDLVAKYATQVLVLNHGHLIADVAPVQLFRDQQLLKRAGLVQPFAPRFANELNRSGIKLDRFPLTIKKLTQGIVRAYKSRRYRE